MKAASTDISMQWIDSMTIDSLVHGPDCRVEVVDLVIAVVRGLYHTINHGLWLLDPLPTIVLCHGDPLVLDLWVRPLLMLIDETDVGVGQRIVPVLGLGVSWNGQPASFSLLSSSTPPFQHCLGQPTQRSLLCSQALRSSSFTFTPRGSASLFCPGRMQGHLSQLL